MRCEPLGERGTRGAAGRHRKGPYSRNGAVWAHPGGRVGRGAERRVGAEGPRRAFAHEMHPHAARGAVPGRGRVAPRARRGESGPRTPVPRAPVAEPRPSAMVASTPLINSCPEGDPGREGGTPRRSARHGSGHPDAVQLPTETIVGRPWGQGGRSADGNRRRFAGEAQPTEALAFPLAPTRGPRRQGRSQATQGRARLIGEGGGETALDPALEAFAVPSPQHP